MTTNEITKEQFFSFSFSLDKGLVDFIRSFVNFQRQHDHYYYNQSDAIREGISLLKKSKKYNILPERPLAAKIPTRRGKSIGSGMTTNLQLPKFTTSFYISEADKQFIYNVIYHHVKLGNTFGKEDFIKELVTILKQTYSVEILNKFKN